MSLIYEILKELGESSLNYKGVKVNLFGIPKFKSYKRNTVSGSLAYLGKKGFIEKHEESFIITRKGREYVKRKYDSLKQFDFKFKPDAPKNLMVMYDVPEVQKAEREWLRWHLKKFNYKMIQKSVWVGPSPLPKEFLDYLKKIKIGGSFKTFKLAKLTKDYDNYDFKK
ncbi:hypothetical protein A2733_00160 [Candidatus Nomurabacteria bacterium RIFCSPHIGHO2_01_FULL_40_20]|uniref:Transcriptional repressor PaaX-like central Cas2-like domain-containing protein n=1 Tax=Candidatus Nomurabacteria bacterium RIFCSPHIGHO2_01_FULL_40_20 TaxID=1801738 RepID=A0A1F6V232_9BACT|nr:MAG: hypothetical protein A2733_00160 [Candidatus Nomurabacteria bacterium RIFCSPHIGHO2_01_FULL_40_20]